MAGELADKAEKGSLTELALAVEKMAQAIKSESDVAKSVAEIEKLKVETRKALHDLEQASRRARSEGWQHYVAVFAPIATTLVLCFTVVLQAYQFVKSEGDKQQAAEDTQWSAAVRLISQNAKLSPIAATLNPFLKSKRYAEVARKTATQVLMNTKDPATFNDLLNDAFSPLSWSNIDDVLQLDRGLGTRYEALNNKSYDETTQSNATARLTPVEAEDYSSLREYLLQIGGLTATLLKAPRPVDQNLDLRSSNFMNVDWSGVNLSGANLENVVWRYIDLKDADLRSITSFSGAYVFGVAWWEAKRISPELLAFLMDQSKFDPKIYYGIRARQISIKEYEDGLAKLKRSR
jgi:hypothetical protein